MINDFMGVTLDLKRYMSYAKAVKSEETDELTFIDTASTIGFEEFQFLKIFLCVLNLILPELITIYINQGGRCDPSTHFQGKHN